MLTAMVDPLASSDRDQAAQGRMSFGDHLEELRRRVFFALLGIAAAIVVCIFFAKQIILLLCRPVVLALSEFGYPPTLYQVEVQQLFLTYLQVSMLSGLILASPWVLYQVWSFVASGLYRHEKKFARVFGPASLGLFLLGAAFAYLLVMPFAMRFFVSFNAGFAIPQIEPTTPMERFIYGRTDQGTTTDDEAAPRLTPRVLAEPPPVPQAGQPSELWIDAHTRALKTWIDGQVVTYPPPQQSAVTPIYSVGRYIRLTVVMMLVFGIGFQTPLVIMFLARTGIVPTSAMAGKRRVVILVLFIVAMIITPPDVVSQILLAIPMWGLFELGLVLGRRMEKKAAAG
jgi:sec-independent protein translocase protein TatC